MQEYYLRVIIGEKQMDVAPISYVLKADGLYLYAFERKDVLIKIASITYSHITNIEFEPKFYSGTNKLHNSFSNKTLGVLFDMILFVLEGMLDEVQ
ncbi:hypothetical protein LSPH24S_04470 [Lysinibacillus sphaericus]